MCGRYAFNAEPSEVQSLFGLVVLPEPLDARFNVAPRQKVPTVVGSADGTVRKFGFVTWGLLPPWAESSEYKIRPINARDDTVSTSGMFRPAFAKRRCLLPATGFYEWQQSTKPKQPYHVAMRDRRLFAMAGLWECWTDGTTKLFTCCSITTEPNDVLRPFHDRMPVIVRPENFTEWLAADTPVKRLRELLTPYPADEMEAFPVSTYVSKATNEGPKCLEPLAA